MFNRDFRGELTAALSGADLFTTGAALHVPAPFKFDQVATVAKNRPLFQKLRDRAIHKLKEQARFRANCDLSAARPGGRSPIPRRQRTRGLTQSPAPRESPRA